MTTIKSFVERLKKIGINVELAGNFPWVYLDKVNNVKVWERFQGNHGFTVFFVAIRPQEHDKITDISKIFKKIREMLTPEGQLADKAKYEEFMEDYIS
jgi:hypothetical protein